MEHYESVEIQADYDDDYYSYDVAEEVFFWQGAEDDVYGDVPYREIDDRATEVGDGHDYWQGDFGDGDHAA